MPTPSAITSDAELERFFALLAEGFKRTQQTGSRQFLMAIGGHGVRLSIAGDGLMPLVRPLAHHQPWPNGAPLDLEISIWESPPGWEPPKPVWKQGQQGFQGEILGLGSGRFQINYHDVSGLFHMFDRQAGKALYWIPRAGDLPYWEIASPFRILFHWWARKLGGHVAHAGAVGLEGRGVLLVGKSGSGKSTAALACLHHGMEFIGDDYVLLLAKPTPTAHSLYSSAKMHTAFLERALPTFKPLVAEEIGPENKSVFYLHQSHPGRLRSKLELAAVVMPQVSAQSQPALAPRPTSEGLLALAPSTLFQLPDARRETMAFFSSFLRGLPVYALRSGNDLGSGPKALCDLLGAMEGRLREVGVG